MSRLQQCPTCHKRHYEGSAAQKECQKLQNNISEKNREIINRVGGRPEGVSDEEWDAALIPPYPYMKFHEWDTYRGMAIFECANCGDTTVNSEGESYGCDYWTGSASLCSSCGHCFCDQSC